MRLWKVFAVTVAALSIAGCGKQGQDAAGEQANVNVEEISVQNETLVADLRALSEARILFGHQSVGRNILAGLAELSEENGVPLRVLEITGAPPEGPGLFHSNIGSNGDPDSKCEMFAELLTAFGEPHYDLAMLKFCYVDLGRDTPLEVAAMLDRYSRLVEKIATERPDVRLVHVTVPLRATPRGKKTALKRFLGMSTAEDADNVLRNAFNDALRERYADEPLFDLAAMESTLPDGSRSGFEHDGKMIYTLANGYTYDRGHLNEQARKRAAAVFVAVLADALESRPDALENVARL